MSQPNILVSNGTCYSAAGQKLNSEFIPCGNDAFGNVACCGAGDNCLADSSCFGVHGSGYGSYLTYQAGCTDPEYKDASCPNKQINQPWIALTRCDDDTKVWAACSQINNPTTLQPGASCSCTVAASATIAFTDAATLTSICSLPASTGESIQFFTGHIPTQPPTSAAPTASPTQPSTGTSAKATTSQPASTSAKPTTAAASSSSRPKTSAGATNSPNSSSSAAPSSSSSSPSSSSPSNSSNNSGGSSSTAAADNTTSSTSSASSSAASAAAASADSSSSSTGLSTGAKVGIGVGVALGALVLLAIVAAALLISRRRRRQREALPIDHEVGTSGVGGLGGGAGALGGGGAAAAAAAAAEEEEKQRKDKKLRDSGTTANSGSTAAPAAAEADSRPVSEADGQPAPPWALGRSELGGTPAASQADVEAQRQRFSGLNGPGGNAAGGPGELSPVAELPGNEGWLGDARPDARGNGGGGLSLVGPRGAQFPGEEGGTKP